MKKNIIASALVGTVALGVGVAIGTAVEKDNAPQSCLDAIESAREMGEVMIDFIDVITPYPMMVAEAAEAGASMDYLTIERLTDQMTTINSDIDDLIYRTDRVGFADHAAECED